MRKKGLWHKVILSDTPALFGPDDVHKQPFDEGIPNLTPDEVEALAATMGGTQTNEFIKTQYVIPKDKTLPGGSYIPTPEFLELEPGTQDSKWFGWWYERHPGLKPSHRVSATEAATMFGKGFSTGRAWDVQVAYAKVCNSKVQELGTTSPPRMQHVPLSEVHIIPPRTKGISKFTHQRKTPRNPICIDI